MRTRTIHNSKKSEAEAEKVDWTGPPSSVPSTPITTLAQRGSMQLSLETPKNKVGMSLVFHF